jgi:hypothetical protein
MNFFLRILFFLVIISTILLSCKKKSSNDEDEIVVENKTDPETVNISQVNGNESHNSGQNCMTCHNSGGTGKGVFKVAGTLYDSLLTSTKTGGVVKLWSGINGTGSLIASINVDSKGNFFTTESVNFGNGLYPVVINSSNSRVKHMVSMLNNGACNSCHGNSQARIWVP